MAPARDPRFRPEVGDKILNHGKVWTVNSITKVKMFEFPPRILLQCGPKTTDSKNLTYEEFYEWAASGRPLQLKTQKEED